MSDRYFVFADGEKEGPYTQEDLRMMLEDESISFKDYCIRDGSTRRRRLDALFEVVPESEKDGDIAEEEEEDDWEYAEEDEYEEDVADVGYENEEGKDEEDVGPELEVEEDEEEEADEEEETNPRRVVYAGHPSYLTYPIALLVAAVCGIGGYLLGPVSLAYFIIGSLVAVASIVFVVVDRSTRHYLVTARRVEAVWGLIAKSSTEVLIGDIRTINVKKSGLLGLIGIGNVEFSSAGDHIDVAFNGVWAAQRVKLLVRELQDAHTDGEEEWE